jgi:hypothetical protein
MRSSHAVPTLAIVAAASIVALLLMESGLKSTWSDLQDVVMTSWRFFALFAVIFAVGGWWTARTWRQLWRCGRSAWERLAYDYGVRLIGFSNAIGLILISSWLGWTADSGPLFGAMMIAGALAGVFFGLPVMLYFGYFMGSIFAAIVKAEHDSNAEIGEPPHLT